MSTRQAVAESGFVSGEERIDRHRWVEAVLAPLPGPDAYGMPADDHESWDEIESDLMKRGTLVQASIRWSAIAEIAAALLRTSSKDLRLLQVLVHAAPHLLGNEALPVCMVAAAQFHIGYGGAPHPRNRPREKLAELLVKGLTDLMPSPGRGHLDPVDAIVVVKACDALAAKLAEISPDLGLDLGLIGSRAAKIVRANEEAHPLPALAPAVSATEPKPDVLDAAAPPSDQLRLDPSNERALKQSLATVAEFLLELNPAHPLAYRLRRFSAWYGISSLPPLSRSTQRSVLHPVSEDIAENYRQASERGGADTALVMRLERTCGQQPFWFEGQYLQYQIALNLGREEVAQAIREEASRFLRTVPGVEALQFSDGAPMIPEAVQAWLEASRPSVSLGETVSQLEGNDGFLVVDRAFLAVANQVQSSIEAGHIDEALVLLDETRGGTRGLRNQTVWDLFILENLRNLGLRSHAARQADRLLASIAKIGLAEWEPELLKRIERLKG